MKDVIKLFILLVALTGFNAFGQKESDKLKKDQKELEEKIQYTEKLLESTKEDKSNLTNTIALLERKINYRSDLLRNIEIQLSQLVLEIETIKNEIEFLTEEIERQKQYYKLMLVQAYRMRNSSASLMFILSSKSFNQANKRMEYLHQLTKYRENQIKRITESKQNLEDQLTLLEQKKIDQANLAEAKKKEQHQYVNDRESQKQNIASLEGKELELKNELANQKKKAQEIERAINKAIRNEIAATSKKNNDKPLTVEETKEITLSTKGFEDNKGRLPWPVAKGEITKGYGKQPHPVHANVFTYNNGVDITTVKGSTVRAVYAGEVTSVIIIPGAGKAVIIAHGNYRTIYSNLQETYVTAGDKVSVKQEIGALLVNNSGNSEVHFEIRKISTEGNITNVNPTYWLYR